MNAPEIHLAIGNEKLCTIYLEKNIFFKIFYSLFIFFVDSITLVISSTQITCDVMHVLLGTQKLLHSLQRKKEFFYKETFSEDLGIY